MQRAKRTARQLTTRTLKEDPTGLSMAITEE